MTEYPKKKWGKSGGITVTISKPSHAIALSYGSNVSQGIAAMQQRIDQLEHEKDVEHKERDRKAVKLLNAIGVKAK
jgi:hypothetical protein